MYFLTKYRFVVTCYMWIGNIITLKYQKNGDCIIKLILDVYYIKLPMWVTLFELFELNFLLNNLCVNKVNVNLPI